MIYEECIELGLKCLRAGMPIREVAPAVGVDEQTLRRHARRTGVPPPVDDRRRDGRLRGLSNYDTERCRKVRTARIVTRLLKLDVPPSTVSMLTGTPCAVVEAVHAASARNG